jgi:hypothetical protein
VIGLDRDVLLLGSVGLSSAEEVFRTCSQVLGSLAPRFPDGETGWARSVWVQCQRPFFLGNPALEMVEADPERPGEYRPARIPSVGIYGHTRAETYRGRARLRSGANAVEFDNLGYADWALESYATFTRLKSERIIPSGTRFQVSLPTPSNILNLHVVPEALPDIGPAYASALFDEIARIADTVPHHELTIQWDSTHPVVFESASAAERQRVTADLASLTDHVPADVELGFHLCYGDFEHVHGVQPPDLSVCVEMTHGILAAASRPVSYVHMPVPRDRSDVGYVAPLEKLRLPANTRLYLGLVHYTDAVAGTRERLEAASTVYADFGIATECGMGRRVGQDIPALLRIHREAASPRPSGPRAD